MLENVPQVDLVFALGFFIALAVRRGRVAQIVSRLLGAAGVAGDDDSEDEDN